MGACQSYRLGWTSDCCLQGPDRLHVTPLHPIQPQGCSLLVFLKMLPLHNVHPVKLPHTSDNMHQHEQIAAVFICKHDSSRAASVMKGYRWMVLVTQEVQRPGHHR